VTRFVEAGTPYSVEVIELRVDESLTDDTFNWADPFEDVRAQRQTT